MKILLTLFVLLFSTSIMAEEFILEDLKIMFDSCLETAAENDTIGSAFEYCGCTVGRISEAFTYDELNSIYSSGDLENNNKLNSLVNDCNQKIGY